MTFWIDAHLSPLIAAWLMWTFEEITAVPLRDLGLRDADDEEIFRAAKAAGVVVLTKDADFRHLLNRFGPPPQVLWLTCGNTSNERLQEVLRSTLPAALELLAAGEPLIEIGNALP
jgi:predicted nuclease of predicted toxin-antitoxin system